MTPTIQEVLDKHGIHPNRSKNIPCPAHDDNDPSCRINEDYVYCFSCGWNADPAGLEAQLTGQPIETILKAWSTDDPAWKKTKAQPRKATRHEMLTEIYTYWVIVSQDKLNAVLHHLPEWLHETAKDQIMAVFDDVLEKRRDSSPAELSTVITMAKRHVDNWADHWLKVKT